MPNLLIERRAAFSAKPARAACHNFERFLPFTGDYNSDQTPHTNRRRLRQACYIATLLRRYLIARKFLTEPLYLRDIYRGHGSTAHSEHCQTGNEDWRAGDKVKVQEVCSLTVVLEGRGSKLWLRSNGTMTANAVEVANENNPG